MNEKKVTEIDCTKHGVSVLITEYMRLLDAANSIKPERDHARSVYERLNDLIKDYDSHRRDVTYAIAMLHGENLAWTGYESHRARYEDMIEQAAKEMAEKDAEDE